jgi:uncharacterized membrane protein YphA (DoxX/SURF4 family)
MVEVPPSSLTQSTITKIGKRIAYVRIGFGIIWLVDAVLKFEPSFYTGILTIIKSVDAGGPTWLNGWYNFWFSFVGLAPHVFAVLVIILECFIAFSLIFGFGRKITYLIGGIFSFLLWSVAEGFGGLYVSGSTDVGAGIMYVILFALFYVVDTSIPSRFSLDTLLEKHISWWHRVARSSKNQYPEK